MSRDTLARGAKSASYGMPIVTQAKWDSIFSDKADTKKQPCPMMRMLKLVKKKEDCSPSGG